MRRESTTRPRSDSTRNLPQAQNNLGVLLLQQGRLAEGALHLREAVRLVPGDLESQYNLAMALNQQEDWEEAAAILTRLAPGRPDDAKLHYEFGLALAHLGQNPRGDEPLCSRLAIAAGFSRGPRTAGLDCGH